MSTPGWYRDPAAGDDGDHEELRWWDGTQWTDQVRRKELSRRSPWRGVTIALTVVFLLIGCYVVATMVVSSMLRSSMGNK